MNYVLFGVVGAVVGALLAWRVLPARTSRMIIGGGLGGALGAAAGVVQPTMFLAENGLALTLAFYMGIGAAIGLALGGAVAALRARSSPSDRTRRR